ncbi:protein involved in temperature-dependent protein secretion [Sphingomonas sp. UYAg733]
MRDADDFLKSGNLDGARKALVEVVRAKPGDAAARMFLFQLLSLAGEWDKARIQMNTLAQLSPESQMLSVVYGQAIDAERVRGDVFAGRVTATQHVASDWLQGIVEAIHHFSNGRTAEGDAARDAAFDAAPDVPGSLDDAPFDWLADGDGRFGPCVEAIIAGRYGLLGFDAIDHIKSEGPMDLRDLVWYPVQIALRSGQSVAALLPARYPDSETSADPAERLTRATGWSDGPGGSIGSGQHLWTLSTGEERGLLSLRLLKFA